MQRKLTVGTDVCTAPTLGWGGNTAPHRAVRGEESSAVRALVTPETALKWNIKPLFPLTLAEFHPTNKSPAAPRDAVIAASTAASPGTAINAIPVQAVHTQGSEGLGPPFICFSTEPNILPGGQSHELRQHRNAQTRLCRATLSQGPVGSVPKTRPRARCRPSATLSLVVCTELRYWFGALTDFHMKISPCKNVNLCLGWERGEEIMPQ